MKLFHKTATAATEPIEELEHLERALALLRSQQAETEGQLAQARTEESTAREDVGRLEDAVIFGEADISTLRATRERIILAAEVIEALEAELSDRRRLTERAADLLPEARSGRAAVSQ